MHSGPSMIFQLGAASPSSVVTSTTSSARESTLPANSSDNKRLALIYCTILAFQFGLQPLLASRFTSTSVSKASVVIATEFTKILIAAVYIILQPAETRSDIFKNWTPTDSLKIAALPAVMYAIQNLIVQHAYVMLDSMTFNLLNQTKVP